MAKIQAIRGMNDILPDQTPVWQYLEQIIRTLMPSYGYQEIRFPILEQTQLFERSIGEVTDIVEKEMYTFKDRNGDSLTLRPEGTAGCVRAAEQHGLLYNQLQKLWYMGSMYRHERPQKGRYRQFTQLGVEAFGMAGVDIEAELLMLSADFWQRLGIGDTVQLEINNLGNSQCRAKFGIELNDYLQKHRTALDEDSQRRLDSNVLRVLDSKAPQTHQILKAAPKLSDYIDDESQTRFEDLISILAKAGIHTVINTGLVRGLDYYNGLVFEWTTDKLGAQGAICAGGRFDGLVKQLGGKGTPAVGFAVGLERLILLLDELAKVPDTVNNAVDVYIAVIGAGGGTAVGSAIQAQALLLARELREKNPELQVLTHCAGGKYNNQLKKAYGSGAKCAVILEGESEVSQIKVRVLDGGCETEFLKPEAVNSWITQRCGK